MLVLPSISNSNMELGNEGDANGQSSKRTNSRGIRVVGNRIYDSANGKTCHQCRQKTRDYAAACKNVKNGKPCPIKLCHKCLLNRYGEKAEEVEKMSDWACPKCRGICNCSFCMKKRGQQPTGQLAYTAKASGFKSVSDMLCKKASEDLGSNKVNKDSNKVNKDSNKVNKDSNKANKDLNKANKDSNKANKDSNKVNKDSNKVNKDSNKVNKDSNKVNNVAVLPSKGKKEKKRVDNSCSGKVSMGKAVSPITQIASDKELVVLLSGETGKENSLDGNSGLKLDTLKVQITSSKKTKKTKREGLKEISNSNGVDTDGARQKKRPKRPKVCNEVPVEDAKGNANHATKVCNGVSEKEKKVHGNHGVKSQTANISFPAVSGKQTRVDRNHYTLHGQTNGGLNSWAANDFFDGPVISATKGIAAGFLKASVDSHRKKIEDEIPLPPGTELTEILDIEFPPEVVGNALQFLEFCRVFGKALDLKKGEAEAVLRELVRKQNLRRGQNTLVVQLQIRLLSLILIDSGNESPSLSTTNGNNSWLKALEDLIAESELVLKDFPLVWLEEGIAGYYNLDLFKKLRLLNFLCDEALSTEKLRSYIDDQNSRHAEEVKEAKSKVAAAKEKEKGLRQKLQNEVAKALVSDVGPLSMEEYDALLTKIKSEAAQAHAEMLEAQGTIPKRKQSSDATRIEHEFSVTSGQAFWKIKSYDESAVLLQDFKIEDGTATVAKEKWFVYGPEEKDGLDKYISSRAKRTRRHKVSCMLSNESREANM